MWSWKKQASAAYEFSLARLAINGLLYTEIMQETAHDFTEAGKAMSAAWQKVLSAYLNGEDVEEQAEGMREQNRKKTEQAAAALDGVLVYEYVLNRIAGRFEKDGPVWADSDENMTARLMNFMAVREADEMNWRIQSVMGELPVRFTRQKYYSIVKAALEAYIGGEKRGLEEMLYLLKCGVSAWSLGTEADAGWDKEGIFTSLRQLSFKDMTEEQYQRSRAALQVLKDQVTAESDLYMNLQDMLNDLCVLCMTRRDALKNPVLEGAALRLLEMVLTKLERGEAVRVEAFEEELQALEGMQEQAFARFIRLDPVLEDPLKSNPEAAAGKKVELLLSASPFAVLTEKEHEEGKTLVTQQDVDDAMEMYQAFADPVLKSVQKPVARVIMARALETLPISFDSLEDLEQYVYNSLSGCTDPVERAAVMTALNQLMESEEYAL